MIKTVVIGSGNVAQHLIKVIERSAGIQLLQAYARNLGELKKLLPEEQIATSYNEIKEADVYIIAVSDGAIANVAAQLPFSGRFVVHTSGSVSMTEPDGKNRRGVFYPLQTLSKNKEVNFQMVPLCLETEYKEDFTLLEQLAKAFSGSVYAINSEQRRALHVAAVFVSNFVNNMYAIGSEICRDNAIDFTILKPLIQETADKILSLSPLQAQTGPAVRNDTETIAKHLYFLKDERHKELYKLLSESIQYNAKKL